MNPHQDREDRFPISASDILYLFRRAKFKIICWTIILALSGAFYALSRPIKYQVEGTFREKINKSGNLGGSLAQILTSDVFTPASGSETTTMIKSRKLMIEVIKKLHLQGVISRDCDKEGLFTRIRHNLGVEWAAMKKSPFPALEDLSCLIKVQTIQYEGEVPLFLKVNLESQGSYKVLDCSKQDEEVGQGQLNVPFHYAQCIFTLKSTRANEEISPQLFSLIITPLADTAENLLDDLEVENVKDDKSMLKLSYEHRDRHFASTFINMIMESYQDYLKQTHDQLASIQLGYLRFREEESAEKLSQLMEKHANFLSTDLPTLGFVDAQKELDFLATSEHHYKEKLLSNELEIKRLKSVKTNNYAYYDQYASNTGDPLIINDILREIRTYKQEQDSLELALQRNPLVNNSYLKQSFDQQLIEIEEIQRYIRDLQDIIAHYEEGLLPDPSSPLMQNPRFLVKSWFDRLYEVHQTDFIHWQTITESFSFYLQNLARLFNVQEKILQDRLTHQQNPSNEYQGANLQTATDLYITQCKRRIELESDIRQNQFFVVQLENPHFEITSLSEGLSDPVSLEMIKRASELVLKLKDQSNQSIKDQERLKEELALQRTFLTMHLKQMVQLKELDKQLIGEKVYALQNISLELIRQRISLLEKNLYDYVQSRLENLSQEQLLIQQHLNQLHQEMASLPKRWISEQLIERQVNTNQLIVQEIAKMVESKNIAHNLEVIQSAPIDIALSPVNPVAPGLRLFSFLGALVGALLSSTFVLFQSISKGIQASPQNLKLMGQHISGSLSSGYDPNSKEPIKDEDLDTLRRLHSYLDQSRLSQLASASGHLQSSATSVLILEGSGPDYSGDLAKLMMKKGEKVLIIDLDFDRSPQEDLYGLLHYLQGEVDQPTIVKREGIDHIYTGGVSRFSIELLSSHPFEDLIEKLKLQYDWILAISHALPRSAEAGNLIPLFPLIVITVRKESVEDLAAYTELTSHIDKKATFVFDRSD